ncbi:expressed unknown protein [Seminavis robusta]|uniref:Uncharacterized protein n=1 Tax=Seminavis robusta TaxID=568900 RepID=A0A9N8EII1_9STRA|nr:expressed unknown protein [Seminavis robusta]|eukprot:Sro1189_g250690.1 n/a (181) ;mRNA; r:16625-17305
MTRRSPSFGRFRLGSLALVCCSFFSTILLRAAVTTSTTTTSGSSSHSAHFDASNGNVVSVENENVQMRLTLRQDILDRAPSSQLTFSQVEVMNMHTSDSVTITSIQTTPEETLLIRYDPQDDQQTNQQQPPPHQWMMIKIYLLLPQPAAVVVAGINDLYPNKSILPLPHQEKLLYYNRDK